MNLDAMSARELENWLRRNLDAHSSLRAYARMKAQAIKARMTGRITTATAHERDCDRIYETLPDTLRWLVRPMRHEEAALRDRVKAMADDVHGMIVYDIESDPAFDGVDAFAVAAQVRRLYERALLEEMGYPE